ncbi:HD-GYP domain-containing protein, partial [Lachnospiraceae bacterium JC7]
MIDRKHAEAAFRNYISGYDIENRMIKLKVEHTLRVAGNCELIARSLQMSEELVDFAWFLGLLHDIGRFEQIRRYGTFVDADSVDHAEFGADLLFNENLIKEFLSCSISEEWLSLLEISIRLHNKLDLPEEIDKRTRRFCELIRDADKVDIFRVVCETPFEERMGTSVGMIQEAEAANGAVMRCVLQHRCIPREIRKTRFEVHISHCSMAFELVFPESKKLAAEQGYLEKLLREYDEDGKALWKEKELEQLRILKNEIGKV